MPAPLLRPSQVQAFLFDLDNTLVDSSGTVLDAFQHALRPFGIQVNEEDLERIRARQPHDIFADWLNSGDQTRAYELLAAYSAQQARSVVTFQGIHQALDTLQNRGIPLAVWTGRDRESATDLLQVNGLDHYFHHTVGGGCSARNKPAPDGILKICNELKLDPSRIVVVGDHAHDIEGAQAAGSYSIAAAWGRDPRSLELLSQGAHLKFEQVAQFQAWLEEA